MARQQPAQVVHEEVTPTVSPGWLTAMDNRHVLIRRLVVESSRHPEGSDSTIYLCGECGIVLARRARGTMLEHSLIHCPNCMTLNES